MKYTDFETRECLLCVGIAILSLFLSNSDLRGQEPKPLQTAKFAVPAGFIPFLYALGGESTWEEREDADFPKTCFQFGGVEFGDGADAVYDAEKAILTVTNSEEEILVVENLLHLMKRSGEQQITILMEWIEVDHMAFSDWLFDNRMSGDGTELRSEVQRWIEKGEALIVDSATVAGRSGQRVKAESVAEYVYPTEYDPSEVPNTLSLKDGAEAITTAVTPTAFETRNLGATLEADPVIGADAMVFDLNLAPELVELESVEHWHHKQTDPKFQIHQPTFYTQKITTTVTGLSERYIFLGATRPLKGSNPKLENPMVLQFVRGDVSSTNDWRRIE